MSIKRREQANWTSGLKGIKAGDVEDKSPNGLSPAPKGGDILV